MLLWFKQYYFLTMYISSMVIVLVSINLFSCLQIIPERANATYLNYKYIEYGKCYISRHGRKSPYYINIEGAIKQAWTNNVTIHLIFYEYLHNEYRRSFVEFHFKFCDMINKDPYVGGMLQKHGVVCPAPAEYHLLNMTVPTDNFPNVFPISKAKVELLAATTDTAETILKAYILATFVSKKKKNS